MAAVTAQHEEPRAPSPNRLSLSGCPSLLPSISGVPLKKKADNGEEEEDGASSSSRQGAGVPGFRNGGVLSRIEANRQQVASQTTEAAAPTIRDGGDCGGEFNHTLIIMKSFNSAS